MLKKLLIYSLIIVFTNFPFTQAKAESDEDKPYLKKIITTFDLKLRERLDNKDQYIIIASLNNDPYSELMIFSNTASQIIYLNEQERAVTELRKDFIDSIGYSLNLILRDAAVIKRLRMAFEGMNFKVAVESGEYKLDLPSINRPLDPMEEKEKIIDLENRALDGGGPDISQKKIELEKELEETKKLKAQKSPFRIKFGLFTDIRTDKYLDQIENNEEKKIILEYGPQLKLDILTLENEIKYVLNYDILNKEFSTENDLIEIRSSKIMKSAWKFEFKNKYFILTDDNVSEFILSKRILTSFFISFKDAVNWEQKSNSNSVSAEIVFSNKSSLKFNNEYNWLDHEYKVNALYKIKF